MNPVLARAGWTSACVEEVLRNNSISGALGIALPLLLWQNVESEPLLVGEFANGALKDGEPG